VIVEIDVWYGGGGPVAIGPIAAECIEEMPDGRVHFRITDTVWWKDNVGYDGPPTFTYERLRADGFVRYDAYAWCPKGMGPAPTKWW
jgi:hypothetical protein